MKSNEMIRRLYWVINIQFGLDLKKTLRSMRSIPRYARDFLRFRTSHTGKIELVPCLHDWYEEAGSTKDEYFWQDLLVAKIIFKTNPVKHVDIGSRVDGFVAHVASFRDIEVFDVRRITTKVPSVTFKQVDFMYPVNGMEDYCDSLSCLHALEHFGLGRYGDTIDPKGFERGFTNMVGLLKNSGMFYLSVPIGIHRVEFNANRVFDPRAIINLAIENFLKLSSLTIIRNGGIVEKIEASEEKLAKIASQRYVLGIFTFMKITRAQEKL